MRRYVDMIMLIRILFFCSRIDVVLLRVQFIRLALALNKLPIVGSADQFFSVLWHACTSNWFYFCLSKIIRQCNQQLGTDTIRKQVWARSGRQCCAFIDHITGGTAQSFGHALCQAKGERRW